KKRILSVRKNSARLSPRGVNLPGAIQPLDSGGRPWIQRIGSMKHFVAVIVTVAVSVRMAGIGSVDGDFVPVGETVAIEVDVRGPVGRVEGIGSIDILFVVVGDAV